MCRTTFCYYFSGIINTLRAEPDVLSSVKRRLYLTQVWDRRSPNSGLVNLVLSRQTVFFFECEHPFIDKPMVITEPAVPSTQLLGLGSKLYPSNMLCMLNKDLTRFMQYDKMEQAIERRCWQGVASTEYIGNQIKFNKYYAKELHVSQDIGTPCVS